MRTQQAQPDVWRTEAANHEDLLELVAVGLSWEPKY